MRGQADYLALVGFVLVGCAAAGQGRVARPADGAPATAEERSFFHEWGNMAVTDICKPSSYFGQCFPEVSTASCTERFTALFDQCAATNIVRERPLMSNEGGLDAGLVALDCARAALDAELDARRTHSPTCDELRSKLYPAK
jgi:hypothetical protein